MAAVTVQVLILGASTVEWPLPQLPQVRVHVGITVARPAQAIGEGATATGAIACGGLGAAVARPHQPILFVIAEVLRLASPRATLPRHSGLGGGETDHIAGRVIAQALTENAAARTTATLLGGRHTRRAQIGIIAELLSG